MQPARRHRARPHRARPLWLSLVAGLLLASFSAPETSWCETIEVPGDYPTIQEAIDAAVDGDLVLVEPDLYVENIDFLGKAITVQGTGDVADTILNGVDLTLGSTHGCVVTFVSGEGADSVLDGFTITAGTGFQTVSTAGIDTTLGGGIFCSEASPTIRNCVICDNFAIAGGGIWLFDSAAQIEDTVIEENDATFGGGVRTTGESADPLLLRCTIRDNTSDWGGGVDSGESLPLGVLSTGNIVLEECTVIDNTASVAGGGVTILANGTVTDTELRGNSSSVAGGGTWILGVVEFTSCTFADNSSLRGGAIFNTAGSRTLDFERCLFYGNSATWGGVYSGDDSTTDASFVHCTIADNSATEGGGVVYLEALLFVANHTLVFGNSILWGNGDDPIEEGMGSVDLEYCDIEGGAAGVGNFDEDPLFNDPLAGIYTLGDDSPCIDAGDPDSPLDPDGTTADLGAFFTGVLFKRGDVDGNGTLSALLDSLYLLQWAFTSGNAPLCMDAADADDNGTVSALLDSLMLLQFQFQGGVPVPAPGIDDCGVDPTVDDLDCETPPDCS